jgi:hypothetical protein
MDDLHKTICEAVDKLRDELAAHDIGYFYFEVSARGRTQTGRDAVKVSYRVGSDFSTSVEGNSLSVVAEEFTRREGWKQRNAPLALPPCPCKSEEVSNGE